MKKITQNSLSAFVLGLAILSSCTGNHWRSSLYPENWEPGYTDEEGRFLHDFSYAGYHSGLDEIPFQENNLTDVTKAPYFLDNTGKTDIREGLQRVIDDVARQGGGVVYLPEGTYMFAVPDEAQSAFTIKTDNIIIRGDGPDKTFLLNTTWKMREKVIFNFRKEGASWNKAAGKVHRLAEDVGEPTFRIHLEDTEGLETGDTIMVRTDITEAFIREHKIYGDQWSGMKHGIHIMRKITAIDTVNNIIEIDVPTRYAMKTRDNARVYEIGGIIKECGMENLSFGNVQHPGEGWKEMDYCYPEKASYDVHFCCVIMFNVASDCWVKNVHSFRPEGNDENVHILSNFLTINASRFISVENCNFQRSQFEGAGGNGYMYTITANDCLLKDCHGEHGRHDFDFKDLSTSGNVLLRCSSKDPSKASDFHMHLCHANLIDNFSCDNDMLSVEFRPWGAKKAAHMYSATECVLWNTECVKAKPDSILIKSFNFGNGYVIGTRGAAHKVVTEPAVGKKKFNYDTSPADWVEGVGEGDRLEPQSLYEDQLEKRINRIKNHRK